MSSPKMRWIVSVVSLLALAACGVKTIEECDQERRDVLTCQLAALNSFQTQSAASGASQDFAGMLGAVVICEQLRSTECGGE